EQAAAQKRLLPYERGDRAEREQRRPEVEARVEQGSEHERGDGEEEERRPDARRAGVDPAQGRGEEREAAGAADAHEDRERRRVAPAHPGRQEERGQRGGRVLEGEV